MKDKVHHYHYTGEYTDHYLYGREYRRAVHSICNSEYSVPKRISIAFHDGSNYDYHFLIKELVKEFKKQFTCFGENDERYIILTIRTEKKITRSDKNGEEVTKYLCYILQFIDSARFMAYYQILSVIFGKGFTDLNVNTNMMRKKCGTCGFS